MSKNFAEKLNHTVDARFVLPKMRAKLGDVAVDDMLDSFVFLFKQELLALANDFDYRGLEGVSLIQEKADELI